MPSNWPALILGLILIAYWGRVVRLVRKIRKATGKSANFYPREAVGQILRFLWYPLVVAWIAVPLIAGVARRLPRGLTPVLEGRPAEALGWAGAVVGALAFAGTLVCWKKMGKSWRMGINPDEKTQLVFSGPYAFVRHPIYALSSLLMAATVATTPSVVMILVGLVHCVLLQWEARREEKHLLVHHGQAYGEYCRNVGRFLPRSLKAYRPG